MTFIISCSIFIKTDQLFCTSVMEIPNCSCQCLSRGCFEEQSLHHVETISFTSYLDMHKDGHIFTVYSCIIYHTLSSHFIRCLYFIHSHNFYLNSTYIEVEISFSYTLWSPHFLPFGTSFVPVSLLLQFILISYPFPRLLHLIGCCSM